MKKWFSQKTGFGEFSVGNFITLDIESILKNLCSVLCVESKMLALECWKPLSCACCSSSLGLETQLS